VHIVFALVSYLGVNRFYALFLFQQKRQISSCGECKTIVY
jgi:hypothetical protein